MLKLENACKIYSDSVVALSGLSLTVPTGAYLSITGASGSGKSTLMHLLGLLDTLSAGSYFLNEIDTAALSDRARATLRNREIGFVFQQFHLLPALSALDNVCLPLALAGVSRKEQLARAAEVLCAVGLAHRLHHKPAALSGGQQQRVAIARAIVHHPALLLADEPTAGLDAKAADEVLSLFDRLWLDGHTIVLITHDHAAARRAHLHYQLSEGRLFRQL